MNGFNKVILMGTVGADAEVKTLEGGMTVANMSIAVNETYSDKDGNRQQKTEWFRIEAWKGLANFLGQFGKKGQAFLIEGRLKTESYEQDGVTKYTTKVVANSINFAGGKPNGGTQSTPTAASTPAAAVSTPAAAVSTPSATHVAEHQTAQYITNEQFSAGMQNNPIDDLPF